MWKNAWVSPVVMLAFCVFAGVTNGVASADDNRPAGSARQQCEKANAAAETRCQRVCREWRGKVTDLRRPERLRRVASEAAGFEEKLAQGVSLFENSSGQVDRMRNSLRKHVADERTLAKSMAETFAACQKELIAETIALYGKTGIGRAAAQKAFPPVPMDTAPLERAFDPVVTKAKSLATEDWFRFGLVNVGSDLVADGLEQVGRSAGVWNTEDGSLGDFLAGLMTQIAVEATIDHLTDPTEQFAQELQTSMARAERELLDGPSGLLTATRKITTLHQQSRLQHLGLAVKGGK